MAVVDDQLRVRGLAGLRVADASIMRSSERFATVLAVRECPLVVQPDLSECPLFGRYQGKADIDAHSASSA
jgi:hypothetical protein